MGEPGLSLRFKVKIDGHDVGAVWTKCEGLSVEYDIYEYHEGGENSFVHRLPGRAKYGNLKLSRPLDSDSTEVASWLSSVMTSLKRQTAEVTCLDAAGNTVGQWSLMGVYPVRWNGPSLDTGGNQVATETLELSHNGFLRPSGGR